MNGPHAIDVSPWLGCREPFSALSHLIGAAIFAGLAFGFVRQGYGQRIRTCSLAVLATASVLLLLCSGFYHLQWPGPTRQLLLRVDVAGVFLLIAASMTPVHAILFSGWSRWGTLLLIWTFAITGIVWRILFCEDTPGPEGIAIFLLFGWGSVLTAFILWYRFGWSFIQPAVLAGLAYTVGAIGLMLHWPTLIPGVVGPHEIWHLAVLTGIGLHWRFVNQFASGNLIASRIPG